MITARGLKLATRQHFATGVMGYLASPLWMAQLIVGLVLVFQSASPFAYGQQVVMTVGATAAAKTGVVGLINCLRFEGAKYNILCNAISPSALTRMTESLLPPDVYPGAHPAARAAVAAHAQKGIGEDLALRVYTTRLLGGEPRLVLHGGGNTSAKTSQRDLLGDEVRVLCTAVDASEAAVDAAAAHRFDRETPHPLRSSSRSIHSFRRPGCVRRCRRP
mgnify:CR=1 FL=1